MSTQNTLIVVLTNLRRGVEGVTGTAGQETRAHVAADRVVASLRRQTVVLLQRKMLKSAERSLTLRRDNADFTLIYFPRLDTQDVTIFVFLSRFMP